MKLLIGLGNPRESYDGTRHNFGADVVHAMAEAHSVRLKKHPAHALTGSFIRRREKILLAIPLCFMNESGRVVAGLRSFFSVATADLIICYDDLDLPFGTIRTGRYVSSGGHNGIKSVLEHLGVHDFIRLRLGIGPAKGAAKKFVLARWNTREKKKKPALVSRASECLTMLIDEGVDRAASMFN